MKRTILLFLVLLNSQIANCQSRHIHSIGIDIIQLSSSKISMNYNFTLYPNINFGTEIGYVINYINFEDYDLQTLIIKPPEDCIACTFSVDKNSGYYIKPGIRINWRKNYSKSSFFNTGIHLIYSNARERINPPYDYSTIGQFNSITSSWGLISSLGYEFKLFNRIKANPEIQLAIPIKNYFSNYNTKLYLPGIGTSTKESSIFPMVKLNIIYIFKSKNAS